MSKWYATMAMAAFLALPALAQQKGPAEENRAGKESTEASASAAKSTNVAPAHDFFALPDAPRPRPFPGPEHTEHAEDMEPGRLVPRYEFAFMYEYINFRPGEPFQNFNNHGGTGSFTFNASRWLGLNAEVGGTTFTSFTVT